MAGWKHKGLQHGGHSLSGGITTTCTNADQYYKIAGTWIQHPGEAFVSDGANILTYMNGSDVHFLLNGVSDLSVSAACKITYGLYKNGLLIAATPADFTSASKVGNISITDIIPSINSGDYYEVWCMSSVAGVVVTHNTLAINFWGDR